MVVDEAYVVSDLHLGGEAPFQMFREGAALGGWIDGLLSGVAGAGQRRAIVINGDFVDFLAERPARHFDAEDAVRKLARIALDPAFAPVFAALRRFVAVPGHRLAIVLGNHDLEIALPWVRHALRDLLCGGDEAAAGRLVWSLDGRGVVLRIGAANGPRVLCVHGNEVDAWNVVDHETLRRIGRDGLRDQRLDDWRPNAGTRMVVEVMNDLKRRYPFVDLLKPETQAVVPTLLALDPKAAAALKPLASLVATQQWSRLRIATGFLGDEAVPMLTDSGARPARTSPVPLAPSSAVRNAARARMSVQLLDLAEEDLRQGRVAADLVDTMARAETLGLGGAIWSLATVGDRVEALRAQLRELAQDRSFLLDDRDETFRGLNERVASSIDFLVTGHTHLARAITRDPGRAWYFNTGTWARVFRIDPEVLKQPVAFRTLFDALGSSRIDALDTAPGLVAVRPHLAAFWHDGAGVHGELRQVSVAPPYIAVPVDGTRFTRN